MTKPQAKKLRKAATVYSSLSREHIAILPQLEDARKQLRQAQDNFNKLAREEERIRHAKNDAFKEIEDRALPRIRGVRHA